MKFMQCQSRECKKPFQINQFTIRFTTSYEVGIIKCPHCGRSIKSHSDALFLTHALSAAQEAQFFNGLSLAG
jgi:uncharacterized protein (UPF0212 family)